MFLLAIGGAVLLVIAILAYLRIQDMRERDLAQRLEDVHDPAEAASWVDAASQASQDDAGFFRSLVRGIWPRWW